MGKDKDSRNSLKMQVRLPSGKRIGITRLFTLLVVSTVILSMLLMFIIAVIMSKLGAFEALQIRHIYLVLLVISLVVTTISVGLSLLAGVFPLRPLNRLMRAMHRLSEGDYSVRLKDSGFKVFRDLNNSFNTMAEELQNTEMLRADFVNNFSHEFKTPLVSIKGFAQLIRRGNLTPEEQDEYLEIIDREADRLASIATSVLNLTRLENQQILSDYADFNISEQLRTCILMLDSRFSEKNIAVSADFDEFTVSGNEEFLRQVWINLLDNAVKFTPDGGSVDVSLETNREENLVAVNIFNSGSFIPEESRERIFSKFYQMDTSHSSAGNGLGLPIVKRIVELHGGFVSASSDEAGTTFTVVLPITRD